MASVSLAKLLGPRSRLRPILVDLVQRSGCVDAILDAQETVLVGSASGKADQRVPVMHEDQVIGWASGGSNPALAAALLEFAADQESQKKSLAGELIERYRELNLLYHLSARLAVYPNPGAIAGAALDEAVRIIPAEAGLILLDQAGDTSYQPAASSGIPYNLISIAGLIEWVIQTGKADLANAVPGGSYFLEKKDEFISLVCAPLKTEQRVLGAIILVGDAERVFTAGELKLLNTIAFQAAPMIEMIRLYQIAVEQSRIEHELNMAKQVQESLLPEAMPQVEGWHFSKSWRPARQVSGDYYDLVDEGDQKLGLVIADVTDKGLPAALFMVFARSALRASIRPAISASEIITRANRLICEDSHEGLFATLFYAHLSTETGDLTYVNAGHNPPLFYHAEQDDFQLLKRTGLPLGIEADSVYTECTLRMHPGDFILFYTDGITEAINPDEKEFGQERLKQVVYDYRRASVHQILNAVERALDEYVAPIPINDDATLMIVKRV